MPSRTQTSRATHKFFCVSLPLATLILIHGAAAQWPLQNITQFGTRVAIKGRTCTRFNITRFRSVDRIQLSLYEELPAACNFYEDVMMLQERFDRPLDEICSPMNARSAHSRFQEVGKPKTAYFWRLEFEASRWYWREQINITFYSECASDFDARLNVYTDESLGVSVQTDSPNFTYDDDDEDDYTGMIVGIVFISAVWVCFVLWCHKRCRDAAKNAGNEVPQQPSIQMTGTAPQEEPQSTTLAHPDPLSNKKDLLNL